MNLGRPAYLGEGFSLNFVEISFENYLPYSRVCDKKRGRGNRLYIVVSTEKLLLKPDTRLYNSWLLSDFLDGWPEVVLGRSSAFSNCIWRRKGLYEFREGTNVWVFNSDIRVDIFHKDLQSMRLSSISYSIGQIYMLILLCICHSPFWWSMQ